MNSTSFTFSALWQTTGWTMLQFLWVGGLAALAASLVGRAFRRRAPEARYAVAIAQFVGVSLIPVGLFVWKANQPAAVSVEPVPGAREFATSQSLTGEIVPQIGEVPERFEPAPIAQAVSEGQPNLAHIDAANTFPPDAASGTARDLENSGPRAVRATTGVQSMPALLLRWKTFATTAMGWIADRLPWVWLLGFPLTSLWLLAGVAGAARFRRQCRILNGDRAVMVCRRLQALLRVSRNVTLGASDRIATPILIGIVRPLILLPTSMLAGATPAQLEMILLHELAHVRRWDNLVNFLQRIVEAVLFFHPAVWWLSRRVRLEREHCCDAVALAHGSAPEKYAEMLVQMALSARRPEWVLGTSISHQLILRIRRILKQEDERMQVSHGLVALALSLVLSVAVVTVATAQREPPKAAETRAQPAEKKAAPRQTPKTLTDEEKARSISIQGTVLDTDGQPARWSSVWLLGHAQLPGSRYGATQIEAGRADANGKFEFWLPRWRGHNPRAGEHPIVWILARTRDGALTTNLALDFASQFRDKVEIHELELKALPKANYSGRVVDADGNPISNAELIPELLVPPRPAGQRSATMALPAELGSEYSATTDAKGTFTFVGLPPATKILARVSAPGFGARSIYWPLDKQPELRLEPGGTIRAKLTNAPAADFYSQVQLNLSQSDPGRLDGPEPCVLFSALARPEPDGSIEITDVPSGQYHLQLFPVRGGPAMPQEFSVPAPCTVQSGRVTDGIELALPKVIVARGKVVDDASGRGVAETNVGFWEEQRQQRMWKGVATTNANGEYRAYLLPGKIAVEHHSAPDGYLTPINDIQSPAILHSADFEGPTLRLERAIKVRGTVVDEEGQPVARADVRWIQPHRTGQGTRAETTSDESGSFLIPQVDPQEPLPLRARTATAATAAIVIQPGDLDKPQQITIASKNAFRLKGTLTDESGRPVGDARVAVHWHRTYISKKTRMAGSYGEFEKHQTDAQGRFESAALWPDDAYHVVIEADGFSKVDLPTVKGKSGEVHDYGAVRLKGTSNAISGRVVDSDGKPIADVTVFNSGDAPRIVATSTGKDGSFCLSGLPAGPVHVFAEHDKFRFAGAYSTGKGEEVLLTLTSRSAPPHRQAVDFDTLEKVRRQEAEELQEWVKSAKLSLRPNLRDSRFNALAKSDPEEALKQIGRQSPAMIYRSTWLAAKRLTPFQPQRKGHESSDKKAVDVALRFVESNVSHIGDLEASRQLFAKANAGLMFHRLGDSRRGQPLVDAAAKEWSPKLQPADGVYVAFDSSVVTIAQGLAWTDVPRALGYMATTSDEDRKSQIRSRVIVEVCKYDIPRALSLLNDAKYALSRSVYDDSLKFDLAYRIGAVNPQKAAEMIGSMVNSRKKAEACGWTAVAIGDQDPALARSLVEQGLNSLRHHRQSDPSSFYYEYVPGVAAHLALQAAQIEHPEIDSIVQQVLALRIPSDPNTSTVSRLQSTVNAALFLAFVDPTIAKRLLAELEPMLQGGLLGDGGYQSVGRRGWLFAWVLADPAHAAELIRTEMEKLKDSGEKAQPPSGVQDAFTLMFLPPEERLEYVRMYANANLSAPDRE